MSTNPSVDEATEPKTLDIFQHIKLTLKNSSSNCSCENTNQFYCIPCKVSTCSRCSLASHQRHILLKKNNFELSENKIKSLFNSFNALIKHTPLLNEPNTVKANSLKQIDNFISSLMEKLNEYRERKYNEINTMFNEMKPSSDKLKTQIQIAQNNLKKYVDKNNKLYGNDNFERNDNVRFLLNYDMINLLHQKKKHLDIIAKDIQSDLTNYENIQKEEYEHIMQTMINVLFPIKHTKALTNKKKIHSPTTPNSMQSSYTQLLNQDGIVALPLPGNSFMTKCNEISKDHFSELNTKINKYNKQIESFKKGIYSTISKRGNLKEIENVMFQYESHKHKASDVLFSDKHTHNRSLTLNNSLISNNNNNNNNNNLISTPINTAVEQTLTVQNKDEINLKTNPLLSKYFAYLTLNLYNKHFRSHTQELKSSRSSLLIKSSVHSSFSIDSDDDDVNINNTNLIERTKFGKAIEGSNEVMLYEKKTNKLQKRKLMLNKNPFGYTKFPIGCRSILVKDNLYIIGGKDEHKTYSNVLIYNYKQNTLKRISDLNEGRCYHTLVYNEVFNTIMVIGGDNRTSVELLDPITNRWLLLPELNIARSNSVFYIDKPRGIMYVMFGVEGKFTSGKYSDVIEFLDLSHITNGWMILDYKNKSQIDLRSYMNMYPINNDLLLLYGGVTFRNTTKSLCVFSLVKNEVNKISQKMLKSLRIEAQKNRQLSAIVGVSECNDK